jgi:hypothetical protein
MRPDQPLGKNRPSLTPAWFAILILGAGGVVSWLHLPLGGRVSGLKLPIGDPWFGSGLSGVSLFSFGGLSLLLAILAILVILTAFRYQAWPWISLGNGIWFLVIFFLCNLLYRLDDLFYLMDQRRQVAIAVNFAITQCDTAYDITSLHDGTFNFLDLSLTGLPQQLAKNLDLLSWGMVFLPIAGSILLWLGFSLGPREKWGRRMALLVLILLIVTGIGLGPSLLLDRQLQQAGDAISQGNYLQARKTLNHLTSRHPSLLNWPPFLYLLGQTHDLLGEESPVRHFYLGARLMTPQPPFSDEEQANLSRLRQEWTLAAATEEPRQRRTVRHLLGWALLWDGLQKYRALQAPAALASWQQARDLAPELMPASLFLSKVYLDQRMGKECLAEVARFLPGCNFDFLKSLALALAGDASYQVGLVWEARQYYDRSLKAYHTLNTRAYQGLSGQ